MKELQGDNSKTLSSKVVVSSSFDDGHPNDYKLAEYLLEYGIKGTFYISPRNKERAVIEVSDLRDISRHFEIGAHTLTHPDLRHLDNNNLEKEINGSKMELESILGIPIRTFSYPKGNVNRRVKQAVVKAGFIGARTTKEFHLSLGDDKWKIPTTIHAFQLSSMVRLRHEVRTRNCRGLRYLLRNGSRKSWIQLAIALFEEVMENGGVWHLWGHSWEIEEHGLWGDLCKVLRTVSGRRDVTYLTNSQLIERIDNI